MHTCIGETHMIKKWVKALLWTGVGVLSAIVIGCIGYSAYSAFHIPEQYKKNTLTQKQVKSFFQDGGKWQDKSILTADDFAGFDNME